MTSDELQFCKDWCAVHAKTWQVLNRSQWKYQFHPKTLVRYVEEVRLNETEIQLVLAFLSSDDCIDTLALYDQAVSNAWKPTRAWLEIGSKAVSGIRSVRLYHGLMTEVTGADGPYVTENGCAYKVSLSYYWNQTNPPTVPDSSSGIHYSVGSLSRDAETGLYTYAIEKRERVQQNVPLYLTGETVYAQHKEEVHLGVREANLSSTGQQASVGGGKIVQRKISKNADCTSDVHNTVTVEKGVQNASHSVYVGVESDFESTTHRNQASPMSTTGLAEGTSVENVKTEGGLYDQTIKVYTPKDATMAVESKKTIFEQTTDTLSSAANEPANKTAPDAANGVVKSISVKSAEHGGYHVSETEIVEKPVATSERTAKMTLRGLVVSTESRNQSSAPADPTAIGSSVSYSMTPGGLYNTRVDNAPAGAAGTVEEATGKTAFDETSRTETNVAGSSSETAATTFTVGSVIRKEVTKREDGTKDVSTTTVTAKPWQETKEWRDSYHKHYVCHYRNQPAPIIQTSSDTYTTVTNSFSKNEYGLYDGSWKKEVTLTSSGGSNAYSQSWTSNAETIIVVGGVRRIGGVKKRLVRRDKIVKHVTCCTYSNWKKLMLKDFAEHGLPKNVDPNEYAAYQPKYLCDNSWQYFTFEIGTEKWENIT